MLLEYFRVLCLFLASVEVADVSKNFKLNNIAYCSNGLEMYSVHFRPTTSYLN